VEEDKKKLDELVNAKDDLSSQNASDLEAALLNIQNAYALLQSDQGALTGDQNGMSQLFKTNIDPDQKMIQQDCNMYGSELGTYLLTEKT
jgi:hypothetical protein